MYAPYWKFQAVVIPMEAHFHPARSWDSGRPATKVSAHTGSDYTHLRISNCMVVLIAALNAFR